MDKLNADCLTLIFNEITDENSLHSCILVNKEWCNIGVPILWKEYSHIDDTWYTSKKLINVLLSCLSSSSKRFLSDNDIKLPSTKAPLFNYISFCKFPDIMTIDEFMKVVFEKNFDPENPKQKLLEQEVYKLFVSQCKNIKELWWKTSQPLPLFPGASACFSQLYYLRINVEIVHSDTLHEMAQICKDLKELAINECSEDLPGLISLIDVQRNLNSISILPNRSEKGDKNMKETCKELSKAIARKGNTIYGIFLAVSNISPSFLTSLINLEVLSIVNRELYEDTSGVIKCLRQYLAISEFPNLECLIIEELSYFKELEMIIEKANGNISKINTYNSVANNNIGMLIKAIANNCPNIESLSMVLEPKDFIHLKSLLLNCRQLEYVRFGNFEFSALDENGDELLDILTKFSPNSLTKIFISKGWNYSINTFREFFESCRERRTLHFGLTQCRNNRITKYHRGIIKKYVEEGVINDTMEL